MLVTGDLSKRVEASLGPGHGWGGSDGLSLLNILVFVVLFLLVTFVLLPSPYSNNKVADQDTASNP